MPSKMRSVRSLPVLTIHSLILSSGMTPSFPASLPDTSRVPCTVPDSENRERNHVKWALAIGHQHEKVEGTVSLSIYYIWTSPHSAGEGQAPCPGDTCSYTAHTLLYGSFSISVAFSSCSISHRVSIYL